MFQLGSININDIELYNMKVHLLLFFSIIFPAFGIFALLLYGDNLNKADGVVALVAILEITVMILLFYVYLGKRALEMIIVSKVWKCVCALESIFEIAVWIVVVGIVFSLMLGVFREVK